MYGFIISTPSKYFKEDFLILFLKNQTQISHFKNRGESRFDLKRSDKFDSHSYQLEKSFKKNFNSITKNFEVKYEEEIGEKILEKLYSTERKLFYEQFCMLFFEMRGWIKNVSGIKVNISHSLETLEEEIMQKYLKKLQKKQVDNFFREQKVNSTYVNEEENDYNKMERGDQKEEKIEEKAKENKEEKNERKKEKKNQVENKNKEIEEGMNRIENENASEFLINTSEFMRCLEMFNEKPSKGIKMLVEKAFIRSMEDHPQFGRLLYQNKNFLDPKQISEFLTNKENKLMLQSFLEQLNFCKKEKN